LNNNLASTHVDIFTFLYSLAIVDPKSGAIQTILDEMQQIPTCLALRSIVLFVVFWICTLRVHRTGLNSCV